MAAAIMRWWQMIHNGGSPTVIVPPITTGDALLLESGDNLLLESGDYILLE